MRLRHVMLPRTCFLLFCFFNDTATTEIYTLSLHDALPISPSLSGRIRLRPPSPRSSSPQVPRGAGEERRSLPDRKSTRLNSSHRCISYAVFCLKKKKKIKIITHVSNTQEIYTHRSVQRGIR